MTVIRRKSFSRRVVPVLLLLCGLLPATAPAAVFNPETFTLANGMQVVVIPNHRVPVVTHMVWYKVGSADEHDGKSGIAHFFEHLMFKGTENHPNGEFSAIVARNGGRENAFTSYDYTAYHQTVAVDRLETVMALEADRMTHLILNAEQVEPERQVIFEERRQRTENNPGALLYEQVNAALFLNHPYRRPIIGWMHEVAGLTLDDLRGFYRQWYAPNNAILVVAGDITAEQLKPLAEKYYGPIPRADTPPRLRPQEPPQLAPRRIVMSDPRVGQPSWSRVYLAPSHRTAVPGFATGDAAPGYALEVLSRVLGGGATSPFYRSLVVEQKIAVSAGTYYDPDSMGPARFGLYASPAPGVEMADLEAAVEKLVADLMRDGLDPADIERAKRGMLADAVYARDSLRAGARVLGSALAVGLTVEDVESWPERIKAVTPERVNAALRAVIAPERSVTAQLLPKPGA